LTEDEDQFQNELYQELVEAEYEPKCIVAETEICMAKALANIDNLPNEMIRELTPKARFMVQYYLALHDELSKKFTGATSKGTWSIMLTEAFEKRMEHEGW
jgi:hypothetical protein